MTSEEKEPIQVLQGTLDLIALRILAGMGAQHAYQIATRSNRSPTVSSI